MISTVQKLCYVRTIVGLSLFLTVLIVCSSKAAGEVTYAWWVKAEFTPYGNIIDDLMPLEQIDPSWVEARTITLRDLPDEKEFPDVWVTFRRHGYSFEHNGDFNRDGIEDKAVVGVYRNDTGGTGRFLLILTKTGPGEWGKVYLYKLDGKPGFSVMTPIESGIGLCLCMECDYCCEVIWDGETYQTIWYDEDY